MRPFVRITRTPVRYGSRLTVRVVPAPAFPAAARRLGGRHRKTSALYEYWEFDARHETRVRELCRDVWGTDGSYDSDRDPVILRWVIPDGYDQELWLAGRFIARRDARDYPVHLGFGVTLVKGGFPSSGGSMKYPRLEPYDDTVLEIRFVPRAAAEKVTASNPDVTVVGTEEPLDAETLARYRDQALDDLRQINALLGEPTVEPSEPLPCRCGQHECPPEGLTVAEVAERASVTYGTVLQWCRTGAVKARRFNSRWIILNPLPDRIGRTTILREEATGEP